MAAAEAGNQIPQYYVAFVVTIGAMASGAALGWAPPAIEKFKQLKTTEYEFSPAGPHLPMIGSLIFVGAAMASLPMPILIRYFGRKKSLLLTIAPFVLGWGCIISASSINIMLVGRIILGLAVGGHFIAATPYIAEMSEHHVRGRLCSLFQFMLATGVLLAYSLGLIFSLFSMSLICAFVSVTFFVFFSLIPESPTYYIMQRNDDSAAHSLKWLRGSKYNVLRKIRKIKEELSSGENDQLTNIDVWSSKGNRRALLIGFGMVCSQQATAVNVIIYYATDIFQQGNLNISPQVANIIIAAVHALATFVTVIVVDKVGRRVLLICTMTLLATCNFLLGLYFYLHHHNAELVASVKWIPVALVLLYFVFFALGMGPIPWVIVGEIFGNSIKNIATSACSLISWTISFAVARLFGVIGEKWSFSLAMWIFSFLSYMAAIFFYFCVPETRGLTLYEIQQMLETT